MVPDQSAEAAQLGFRSGFAEGRRFLSIVNLHTDKQCGF
jgi:hypothetical protein